MLHMVGESQNEKNPNQHTNIFQPEEAEVIQYKLKVFRIRAGLKISSIMLKRWSHTFKRGKKNKHRFSLHIFVQSWVHETGNWLS